MVSKILSLRIEIISNLTYCSVCLSLVVLRLFPTWMHYFLSWVLPSTYRGYAYIREVKKLLVPEFKCCRAKAKDVGEGPAEQNNLLSWMMETASEQQSDPKQLAHLELVMSLASIHTSQMNAVHCLYDLVDKPEYIGPIREEIQQVVQEDGPWMLWEKSSFTKSGHLDSFMKESQRFNPPSLLSMHRVMLRDHQLQDGTLIQKGSHISVPVNAIQNDPENTPEPDAFDGDRYFKLRRRPGEGHLHQFSTTTKET